MSSLWLGRFTRPEVLAAVRPALLREFLDPHAEYLAVRGFELTSLDSDTDAGAVIRLASALMEESAQMPSELLGALLCVDELAIDANAEALEAAAAEVGVKLMPNASLLEIALTIWMTVPEVLQRLHQRQLSARVRSFEYFSGTGDGMGDFQLNPEALRQLEHSLSFYFAKKNRGHGCRILHSACGTEHWFVVSHGELFRRQATWDKDKPGVVAFRPQKHDVIVYHADADELRVNAGSGKLREHYRRQFGFYLFGRENRFPGTNKYSLEPLLRERRAALFTGDVDGLEWAQLTEIMYAVEDVLREVRTHKAPDVFDALEREEFALPAEMRVLKASLKLKFTGHTRPRTLTLKPGNVAVYTRDGDAGVVDEWLMRRGFIKEGKVKGYEQCEHVLAIG